jgi:hypothetical protein
MCGIENRLSRNEWWLEKSVYKRPLRRCLVTLHGRIKAANNENRTRRYHGWRAGLCLRNNNGCATRSCGGSETGSIAEKRAYVLSMKVK